MRIRSVHSRRTEEIHRSAIAFIRGVCGAVHTTSTSIEANTASNAVVNLASVTDQVGEAASGTVEIRSQVAGQLGYPGSGRVVGDAEQMDAVGAVLDDESRVQALQGHGVDVKEVDGEQAIGLCAQECAPRVTASRRWRDPAATQDPANRGGGDAVPEPTQLTLNADHAPGPVLRRQAGDQRGDLVTVTTETCFSLWVDFRCPGRRAAEVALDLALVA